MRRGLIPLAIMFFVFALAPSAFANKPEREVVPSQGDVVIKHQCAFPVLGHAEGKEILTTFTDKEGNPVKQLGVFPGNALTFTNLESGASITVMATGSFQLRAALDGSVTIQVTGHGAFFPNPVTGEPGIWNLTGRGRATLDQQGNVTSVDVSGTLVNLCLQLES